MPSIVDVIRPHKIIWLNKRANMASLEEMQYDKLGRRRGIGEDGQFGTTYSEAQGAPYHTRRKRGATR